MHMLPLLCLVHQQETGWPCLLHFSTPGASTPTVLLGCWKLLPVHETVHRCEARTEGCSGFCLLSPVWCAPEGVPNCQPVQPNDALDWWWVLQYLDIYPFVCFNFSFLFVPIIRCCICFKERVFWSSDSGCWWWNMVFFSCVGDGQGGGDFVYWCGVTNHWPVTSTEKEEVSERCEGAGECVSELTIVAEKYKGVGDGGDWIGSGMDCTELGEAEGGTSDSPHHWQCCLNRQEKKQTSMMVGVGWWGARY